MIYIIDTVGIQSGMKYYDLGLLNLFISNGIDARILSNFNNNNSKCILNNFYKGNTISKLIKFISSVYSLLIYLMLKYNKSNIIIYQSFGLRYIDMIFILPLSIFSRFYVIVHDVYNINIDSSSLTRKIQNFFYKKIIKHPLVHSDTSFNTIKSINKEANIIKVPIFKSIMPDTYKKTNIRTGIFNLVKTNKLNLLFIGVIRETKGLDVLLKALDLLNYDICDSINIIIAGNDKDNLFDKYSSCINNINLTSYYNGILNDDEMTYLFTNSSLILLPYKEIYQSAVIDLAYNFKVPVIASDHKSLSEIVKKYRIGLLFENGNYMDLAKQITSFVTNKQSYYANDENLRYQYYNYELYSSFISLLR